MSTNNSSVSAQQLAEQEQEHLFLHYESHNGGGHHGDLPAHLLPGHVTPEPQDLENHGSGNGSSKDAKRNGHGRIFRFFCEFEIFTGFRCRFREIYKIQNSRNL